MGRAVAFFGMLLIERGASTEVLRFRTCPIYVHTYFIRRPAAKYATPKPYGNLTRLSPRESLACETTDNTICLKKKLSEDTLVSLPKDQF